MKEYQKTITYTEHSGYFTYPEKTISVDLEFDMVDKKLNNRPFSDYRELVKIKNTPITVQFDGEEYVCDFRYSDGFKGGVGADDDVSYLNRIKLVYTSRIKKK